MNVYALLCWFDEDPALLERCVGSLSGVADHLIAVDGGYQIFPNATARSHPDQRHAITSTAHRNGVCAHVHTPRTLWAGEPEKRAYMFQYARRCGATPDDWLMVIDTDMTVAEVGPGFRDALADTTADVGDERLFDIQEHGRPMNDSVLRSFYRAIPNLTVKWAHFIYVQPQGEGWRFLWHTPDGRIAPEQFVDLTPHLTMHHRHFDRAPDRTARSGQYYRERDEARRERIPGGLVPVIVKPPPLGGTWMRVRMKVKMSGNRNGVEWPNPGDTIDLPDTEGAKYCAAGLAVPVVDREATVEKRAPSRRKKAA